jgi:hypothetical protein
MEYTRGASKTEEKKEQENQEYREEIKLYLEKVI